MMFPFVCTLSLKILHDVALALKFKVFLEGDWRILTSQGSMIL